MCHLKSGLLSWMITVCVCVWEIEQERDRENKTCWRTKGCCYSPVIRYKRVNGFLVCIGGKCVSVSHWKSCRYGREDNKIRFPWTGIWGGTFICRTVRWPTFQPGFCTQCCGLQKSGLVSGLVSFNCSVQINNTCLKSLFPLFNVYWLLFTNTWCILHL